MKNQDIKVYKVGGMNCPSCAMLIESELEDAGIKCKCSYAKETLEINDQVDKKEILKLVTNLGYKITN